MNASTACPGQAQLKRLLFGTLSDADQAELTRHLDGCPGCQQTLEHLAVGSAAWCEAAKACGERAAAPESAYWPALKSLEKQISPLTETRPAADTPAGPSGDLRLDFLGPSQDPGHLGRLDHFEILEIIGRGGMGVVLKGFDACLQRLVAIKVLDPNVANNETARKRFCREARAAAAVTHEHVVGIHTVEESETGVPYLVMQYVAGQSLQELIDESGPPPLRQIVRIGAQAAAGLAAAHAQNLIHRDVKPGNILLESGGDRVKITDFGLARAAEDVRLTQSGFVAGTPLFMAPEQANGQGIDARTDLFSLGSVLYALCTGKAPFEGSTPFLVLRRITEEAPPPIRDVNPDVPEWLVDVIDTLMAKKPDDRFQSAAEVAALLEDRLTQLPAEPRTSVLASSGSRTLSRRARPRGRLLLPALAGIAVLFAGLYGAEVAGLTHAKEFLAGPPSAVAAEPTPPRLNLDGHSGPVWALAYSPPEGKTLAMALDDGSVKLWELPAGNLRATLRLHEGPIWAVAFSPDGNTLATAGDDNLAKVYDLIDRHEIMALNHPAPVRSMAFSKDGQVLATGCQDGSVRLWDLATGIESTMATKHARAVMAVAFAPDGKTLATGGGDKTVQLWDVERSAERTTLERLTGGVWAVAFSPDGKTLASGGWDQGVRLWDVSTGNRQGLFAGHSQDVRALAFSPDGAAVVSGGDDRTVKVWQAATGQEIASFPGHERTICGVAFAPDAKSVASGGRDGTIKVWDVKVWDLPN